MADFQNLPLEHKGFSVKFSLNLSMRCFAVAAFELLTHSDLQTERNSSIASIRISSSIQRQNGEAAINSFDPQSGG
jgi:hypothetical protein